MAAAPCVTRAATSAATPAATAPSRAAPRKASAPTWTTRSRSREPVVVRRAFLALFAAVFGSFGQKAVAEPASIDPKFPFPIITVTGAEAMATWRRLKTDSRGFPVVLGDDDSLLRIIEGLEYSELPILSTRTSSPYFSPNSAMAPLFLAVSISV